MGPKYQVGAQGSISSDGDESNIRPDQRAGSEVEASPSPGFSEAINAAKGRSSEVNGGTSSESGPIA